MHFKNQDSTTWEKVSSGLHCLLGVSLITWCGLDLVKVSTNGGSLVGMFGVLLLAFGKGIVGVIFLAPSLTRWALAPLFRVVDMIFYPREYEKKIPLDYRLADYYRTTRQFDLAIERYSELVRHYPDEPTAQAWLYILVKQTAPMKRKSKRVLRKARRNLRGTAALDTFENLIESYSSHR